MAGDIIDPFADPESARRLLSQPRQEVSIPDDDGIVDPFSNPEIARKLLAPPAEAAKGVAKEAARQTLTDRAVEGVKDFAQYIYDAYSGEKSREFDLPELGTSGPSVPALSKEGLKMALGYAISAEPEQVADIAVNTLPGATQKKDKHGNPIVTFEGKDYYVNRPGMSEADLFQLLGQAGLYAPAARVGAARSTIPRRIATTGTAAAATSAGADALAGELGSEQGVSGGRALIAGAGGALFEGLSPLASRAWKTIFSRPKLFDPDTGQLTDRGVRMAEQAGLAVDDMGDRLSRIFAAEAEVATDPAIAARVSEAKEFDIPLSRGQVTQEFEQLAREEATRKGAFGESAGNIMRQFDEEQAQAVTGARGRVQDTLAGGERAATREAEGGAVVAEGLEARRRAAANAVDDAYELARTKDARLDVDNISGLVTEIKRGVEDYGIDPQLHPAATRALRNIEQLSEDVSKGARVSAVTLRRIETERRRLGNLTDSAANKADRAATIRMKNELDRWLDDAVDNALFSGDPEALELLKAARATRKRYGELFEAKDQKDEAGRVVQRMIDTDPTPEEVVNYIFGRGKLGARGVSKRILDRLENVFGKDSEEWSALREVGWLRLSQDKSGRALSPKQFAKSLEEALNTNRSLMEKLYSKQELALMDRYKNVLLRTETPEGARNPSQTAFTIARLLRDLTRRAGSAAVFSGQPGLGTGLFTLARTPNVMGARAAKRATKPLPGRPLTAPAAVATGIGGTQQVTN